MCVCVYERRLTRIVRCSRLGPQKRGRRGEISLPRGSVMCTPGRYAAAAELERRQPACPSVMKPGRFFPLHIALARFMGLFSSSRLHPLDQNKRCRCILQFVLPMLFYTYASLQKRPFGRYARVYAATAKKSRRWRNACVPQLPRGLKFNVFSTLL